MGGYSSGIRGGSMAKKRPKLEDHRRLRLGYLYRDLVLFNFREWKRHIRWTYGGQDIGSATVWTSKDGCSVIVESHGRRHVVEVMRTKCNYGGSRPWFRCPVCGRRCGVLVFVGKALACRICARLPYASQCEDVKARVLRREDKLLARIPEGERPKGMWRRTWKRLDRQLEVIGRDSTAAMEAVTKRLEALGRRKKQ